MNPKRLTGAYLLRATNMHRQNILFVSLLLIMVTAIAAAAYANGSGPLAVVSMSISRLTSGGAAYRSFVDKAGASRAPEIASGAWINSEALTIKDLRGRVVLIDFWTFACYNCRNTLPSLKTWDQTYRNDGLTIIGVHSPESETEGNIDYLRREVAALDIKYPVVTDNDYATWNAYKVRAWPTLFLLDKEGRVRWTHVGEGSYDQTEQVIKKLLAEEEPVGVTTR
jgi:thiol-disulfide isomerase/thioredoxin